MSTERSKKKLSRGAYRSLRAELEFLKREGILSPETVDRAVDRYERPDAKGRDFGTLVFLATTTLGVLALGFAAFLVLRYNWNYLTPTVKTAIAVGVLAVAYVNMRIARRFEKNVLAELFAFGGAILFGVNIWQIAQIYQFDVAFPEGAWLWGLGVFALAFFARLPILHYLAVAILFVWVATNLSTNAENFYNDNSTFLLPKAGYSLPFLAALGYCWGVRRRTPSVLVLYLLLFTFWGATQPFFGNAGRYAPFYEVFFGGILWFLGSCVLKNPTAAKTARILGAALVLGFLIPTTYYDYYRLLKYDFSIPFARQCLPFAAIAVFAVAALVVALKRKTLRRDDYAALLFAPTGVAAAAIPAFIAALFWGKTEPLAFSLYGDVLTIALAGIFTITGAAGRPILYWVGTLYFVLWSILRYVDLFGDAGGVLGAACFFVGIAVFLFGASYLFHRKIHERIVESIPNPDVFSETDAKTDAVSISESTVESTDLKPTPPNATVLKIGTATAILFQFAALFGVVAYQTATFADAKTIFVETAPIEPTDLFRGDYVVLTYPFSNPSGSVWENGKRRDVCDISALKNGSKKSRIYAKLKLDSTDGVYKPVALTPEKPKLGADEIALRGRKRDHWRIVYGIEAFYLQEGTGRDIENAVLRRARNGKKALVELRVAPNGRARVSDVKLIDDVRDDKTPIN